MSVIRTSEQRETVLAGRDFQAVASAHGPAEAAGSSSGVHGFVTRLLGGGHPPLDPKPGIDDNDIRHAEDGTELAIHAKEARHQYLDLLRQDT